MLDGIILEDLEHICKISNDESFKNVDILMAGGARAKYDWEEVFNNAFLSSSILSSRTLRSMK